MAIEELVGALPRDWAYTTLGEACARSGGAVQTGPFGSQLHAADYVDHGIPSIMPQNIGDNRVVRNGIAQIRTEDAERLARYRVRPGDIVCSRRGDVERRALIREAEDGWLCGTGCLRVRFGGGHVDPAFASYYLGDPDVREWIVRHAHGATMPNLNTAILSGLPFVLPPVSEQRAIAHILGTLDDKIELNRRTSETLEAMSEVLFKSWFVAFDPIRAKADGWKSNALNSESRIGPAGDDAAQHSAIPVGWTVKGLNEIAEFLNGLALQKYPPRDGRSLPVIKIAQLRRGDTTGADSARADLNPDYVIEDGDVLFSWSGSLECVVWTGGSGALNQHLFKVSSSEFPKWFYYLWIHHHLDHFRHIAAGKATTMGHIQRHHLVDAKVVVPDATTLKVADGVMAPIIERIVAARMESRTLVALRDTLLPKLVSGEIRVKDPDLFLTQTAA